jgi:hypothetical protein
MATKHIVKQGECIESIAFEHGFFWETVWNHPKNKELRELRKSPNVLRPGDEVHIPVKRYKAVDCQSGKRHVFRLKGVPSKLKIVVRDDDRVRANTPYVLVVDGKQYKGTTDAEGRLEHPISPRAQKGKLIVGEGDTQREFELRLGHLDPKEDVAGVQGRLNNLGFDCGPEDGELGPRTQQAIMDYQAHHELEPTGEIDEPTRNKLFEDYTC